MTDTALAKQLHDKATRGLALAEAEQALLHTWYDEQDEAEKAILAGVSQQTLKPLQEQISVATAQLQTVTQRIQSLVEENERLRCEIADLRLRVTQTPAVPST